MLLLLKTNPTEDIMNYDNHPDFNKARTPEESTQEFADARAAIVASATDDWNVGMKYGIALIPASLAIVWWLFLT